LINPFRLARVAAEAESLRLQSMVARQVRRVVYAVVALVFLAGLLACLHVMAWYALRVSAMLNFYAATGIVAGVDLIVAAVFLVLAGMSKTSAAERDALEVRQRAVEGMRSVMSITQLALPAVRTANNLRRRRYRRQEVD
jgi:hypothetical protein